MKKIFSIILSTIIFLSCFGTAFATSKNAETGYDRGYIGGMMGYGGIYAHGVDISSYQDGINFENIKNDGFDFVILRCGTSKGRDEKFDEFYSKAKEIGLDVGVYYYSYATTIEEVVEDSEKTLSYIEDKTFEYPVYLDFEHTSQNELSDDEKSDICYTFMDKLKVKGYLVGLYSMKTRMTEDWVTTSGIRSSYEGWIAHYWDYDYNEFNDEYCISYGMYQYSDRKDVTGWSYGVDANVCYKNYPLIVKAYGFNGYEADLSLLTTEISLDKSKVTLYLTDKCQIEADVRYGLGKTSYKSDNTKIVSVNKNGRITAKKTGTAKITVTNNGVSEKLKVVVKKPTLKNSKITLNVNKNFNLKIKGQVGKATFKSSNAKIATVNSKGKITAKKKGKATISVKTNGITLKCKVTVK